MNKTTYTRKDQTMNVELTIKVCKIELEIASYFLKNDGENIAREILRNISTYLNDGTPKSLTLDEYHRLLDALYRIDKLPPKDLQPDENPHPI